MITPQLIELVRRELAGGTSREAISKQLMDAGWDQHDVDAVFAQVGLSSTPTSAPPPPPAAPMSPPSLPSVPPPAVQMSPPPPMSPPSTTVTPPLSSVSAPNPSLSPKSAPPPVRPMSLIPPMSSIAGAVEPPRMPPPPLPRDTSLPRVVTPMRPPPSLSPGVRMTGEVQRRKGSRFWLGFFTAIFLELLAAGSVYAAVQYQLISLDSLPFAVPFFPATNVTPQSNQAPLQPSPFAPPQTNFSATSSSSTASSSDAQQAASASASTTMSASTTLPVTPSAKKTK